MPVLTRLTSRCLHNLKTWYHLVNLNLAGLSLANTTYLRPLPPKQVASFADELRSLGAEGTEELETLSRSLRGLSVDLDHQGRRESTRNKANSRDNLDEPLVFDL